MPRHQFIWFEHPRFFTLLYWAPCDDEEVRAALHRWREECAAQVSAELEVRFVIERADGKPCIRALIRASKIVSGQQMIVPWKGSAIVQPRPSIEEQRYVLDHRLGAEHL